MFEQQNLHDSLSELGIYSPDDIFTQLNDAYGEASRFYHNAKHVSECLQHFAALRKHAKYPTEIEVAIWFHDAVYDTTKSDNEAQSAEWAKRYLTEKAVDAGSIDRIVEMIMATKTHQSQTPDSALMVDIDLGILGATADAFQAYDSAIRKEFHWVPTVQYCTARAQVLSSFLQREAIYQTELMRDLYESQARINLSQKIEALADGQC